MIGRGYEILQDSRTVVCHPTFQSGGGQGSPQNSRTTVHHLMGFWWKRTKHNTLELQDKYVPPYRFGVEEVMGSPRTPDSCVPSYSFWEINLSPIQEQHVFLKPGLPHHFLYVLYILGMGLLPWSMCGHVWSQDILHNHLPPSVIWILVIKLRTSDLVTRALATESLLLVHCTYSNIMPFHPKKDFFFILSLKVILTFLAMFFQECSQMSKILCFENKITTVFGSTMSFFWFVLRVSHTLHIYWLFSGCEMIIPLGNFVLQLSFSHSLIENITYSLNYFIEI